MASFDVTTLPNGANNTTVRVVKTTEFEGVVDVDISPETRTGEDRVTMSFVLNRTAYAIDIVLDWDDLTDFEKLEVLSGLRGRLARRAHEDIQAAP